MIICDRNKVVGPIPHGLAPLEIEEKSTEIREPKDALYVRAAELDAALRGLKSHRKQRARSRTSTTRVYKSDVHCKRALNGDTMVCRLLGNTCRCLLNRYSDFILFFSCEYHVLCDHITFDRIADPESIAPVGGDAEIASVKT